MACCHQWTMGTTQHVRTPGTQEIVGTTTYRICLACHLQAGVAKGPWGHETPWEAQLELPSGHPSWAEAAYQALQQGK